MLQVWTHYLYSFYFALTTLTTVGYGDIIPTNNDERLYALGCQLVGAFVFGYILSTVAELVSNADPNAVKIESKLSEVRVYLRWHKFPTELTTRVKRYCGSSGVEPCRSVRVHALPRRFLTCS